MLHIKNKTIKTLLSIIAIIVIGYILLNITFLFYAVIAWIIAYPAGGMEAVSKWIGPTSFTISTVLVALFTYLIFRSKWPTLIKAIYLPAPTAVMIVITGIMLYRWPIISYSVSAVLTAIVIYIFYKYKQPWIYYFSVILTALTILIFSMLGGQI